MAGIRSRAQTSGHGVSAGAVREHNRLITDTRRRPLSQRYQAECREAGYWRTTLDLSVISRTPPKMSAMPPSAARSKLWPHKITDATQTSAIPTPAQIE